MTSPANPSASTGGQAPTEGQGQAPTTGQQPQAGSATTPPPAATSSATAAPSAEQLAADLARVTKELGDTRKEAAQHRTELKKFQDAQLTDQQKLEQRATDAEAANKAYQARIASYAVQIAAQKLGIIDPELAALAIQAQLEYEPDGTPKNAEKLLKDLLVAKPYLAGGQAGAAQQQRPPAQSGGATNPGGGARPGVFTREQVRAMSPQEYAANRDAIRQQMAANNGRL